MRKSYSSYVLAFVNFFCCLPILYLGSFVPTVLAQEASFTGLGDFPGGDAFSAAMAVSADGSVVVGYGKTASGNQAFRWTSDTGIESLGNIPGWGSTSQALGVSADGSDIVGFNAIPASDQAFRWTQSTGMVGLGFLPTASRSIAGSISADGTVVVGSAATSLAPSGEAFRWSASEGMVGLGFLAQRELPGSRANGVSADGSVIVGNSSNSSTEFSNEAFRWTETEGMVGLGYLITDGFSSSARAVSADGTVIVGISSSFESSGEAFRWIETEGMVGLGFLPGGNTSLARGVSADGSMIIGRSSGTAGFLWTTDGGMVDLKNLLEDTHGLDLTGWSLSDPIAISADGSTIVGLGINPLGEAEAWVATVSAVPLPAALPLMVSGLIALGFLRRCKSEAA